MRIHLSNLFVLTLASALGLCGCTAYVRYPQTSRSYEIIPGRLSIAVAKFVDERGDRSSFGTVGLYDLKSGVGVDIGKALQQEIASALQTFGYNVIMVETEGNDEQALRSLLGTNKADLILGGSVRNLWAVTPDALMKSAEISGRASVTFVVRGETGARQREVNVTDNRPVDMIGLKHFKNNTALMFGGEHHPGFDALFQQALARLAVAIVEDDEVKRAFTGLRKRSQG